jgi:hypothetical protein
MCYLQSWFKSRDSFFKIFDMKKIYAILLWLISLCVFSACSEKPGKKVLVMASGKVQIKDNVITLEPGTTHTENEITLSNGKVTVNTPAGSSDFTAPDAGLYILNIKSDTLIGSYQRIGTENSQTVISQENLRTRIDSLNQLMVGSNSNAANKNFFIPPNQILKVTANPEAQIIGPYKTVPGSFEGGKEHEIYKFYTNKEMHEIVGKLSKMVDSVKAE